MIDIFFTDFLVQVLDFRSSDLNMSNTDQIKAHHDKMTLWDHFIEKVVRRVFRT